MMGISPHYIEVIGLPGEVLLAHEDASRYSYERPLATIEHAIEAMHDFQQVLLLTPRNIYKTALNHHYELVHTTPPGAFDPLRNLHYEKAGMYESHAE